MKFDRAAFGGVVIFCAAVLGFLLVTQCSPGFFSSVAPIP